MTRTLALRSMTPSVTVQPAIVPTRGTLNSLAHLGDAEHDLALFRREHALERRAHVFDRLVDDVVEPNVDAFALRPAARASGPGRTWKPMMIAPAVAASSTSDSLIAPTAAVDDVDLHLARATAARARRTAPAPSRPRRP